LATKPDPNLAAALAQVKAIIAAQLAPLQNQQKQAGIDARNQAVGTQAAYDAAANMAAPAADQTASLFSNAAGAQAAYAKGFSDEIQKTLGGAADQSNALLAQNNSPQHIDAPQVSNVLFGLGGYNPASVLNQAGTAFAAAAKNQPTMLHGIGLQGYQQALAQGDVAKQKIQDQIDAVNAQLPSLTQTALSGLQSAQADAQQASFNRWLAKQQLAVTQQNANKPDFFGSAEGGYYSYDPATGKIQQQIAGTGPAPKAPQTFQGANGAEWAYDPNTGSVTQLTPPSSGTQKFTPSQIAAFKSQAADTAHDAFWGYKDPKTK
jgi:hypothetical protein